MKKTKQPSPETQPEQPKQKITIEQGLSRLPEQRPDEPPQDLRGVSDWTLANFLAGRGVHLVEVKATINNGKTFFTFFFKPASNIERLIAAWTNAETFHEAKSYESGRWIVERAIRKYMGTGQCGNRDRTLGRQGPQTTLTSRNYAN